MLSDWIDGGREGVDFHVKICRDREALEAYSSTISSTGLEDLAASIILANPQKYRL